MLLACAVALRLGLALHSWHSLLQLRLPGLNQAQMMVMMLMLALLVSQTVAWVKKT